jgi:ribonucleoside-diphosphate reductase alpha chain
MGFWRMSLQIEPDRPAPTLSFAKSPPLSPEPGYQVIRRNGAVTPFDPSKISIALTKAFLAVEGGSAAASRRVDAGARSWRAYQRHER